MEFRAATTVDEAVAELAELGDRAQVLAGGTDVMIQHMRREITPEVLLHIGRITGLDSLEIDGRASIGPLVTHRTLATEPAVRDALPALAEAAATVGGWQTQEVGTVGGNLCNASPAADTAPPLLVAGTRLTLTGPDGEREIVLEEFFKGRRMTERRSDELLTHIDAEPIGAATGETYLKLGRRSAMEVAVVGLAVRLTLDPAGLVERARVAVASVAPRPFRAVEAEAILQGTGLDDETIAEAGRALAAAASPIDDPRATASYRLRMLPRMLKKAVGICRDRAEGRS